MSIYRLFGKELESYNKIYLAIDTQSDYVDLPRTSPDAALLLYNKAISENRYGYLYQPGQISISNSIFGTTLYFKRCIEAEGKISFFSRVDFEVADIVVSIRSLRNVYDRILTVYKYYVDHFNYAPVSVASNVKYHMAAAPFIYREAVCEGFAFSFAFVMNRIGIPCGVVAGESFLNRMNGPHAWNIIKMDQDYYHLDVTWDICTKDDFSSIYDYFMLDDKTMHKDHKWNDYSLPCCQRPDMDLYSVRGLLCKNKDEIIKCVCKQLKLKERNIVFRIISDDSFLLNDNDIIEYFNEAIHIVGEKYRSVQYGKYSTGTVCYRITY